MPLVMHVITALNAGGAERTLTNVVIATHGSSAEHVVVTLMEGGVYAAVLRDAGVTVVTLGMRRKYHGLTAWFRFARHIRQLAPDLVVSWLYHADLMATLARLLVRRTPLVWNLRGSHKQPRRRHGSTRLIVQFLARCSKAPDAVGFNSWAGMRDHQSAGYRPHEWIYLPNGFDADTWRPNPEHRRSVRAELELQPHDIAIGVVARNHPDKGHAELFEAAHTFLTQHPDAHLVLIGAGTQELTVPFRLRSQVLALGVRDDVPRILSGLDIVVLPSLRGEGLPNSIAEAMLAGLPVVTTDVGDARTLVGANGAIVPPGDVGALRDAISHLLRASSDYRRKLGYEARVSVRHRYSESRMIAAYESLWCPASRVYGHPYN